MAAISPSKSTSTLTFEPDLSPLLPTPSLLAPLLAPSSHLSPSQKHILISHAFHHAILFADLPLLTYVLHDPSARAEVDLDGRDEDGRGVLSRAIMGFGTEDLEKETEREECCRLLLAEGADMISGDNAGWTPLHYAALIAPPTLINHLLSHHPPSTTPISLLESRTSSKSLTPLDVITGGHSPVPGREGVALMLEDAMGHGATNAVKRRMGRERREERERRTEEGRVWGEERRRCLMVWGLGGWGEEDDYDDYDDELEEDEEDADADMDDSDDEPPQLDPSWDTMLAFSLPSLPSFLNHIISSQPPVISPSSRRGAPAHTIWLCARFAIAWADEGWVDELVLGALTRVEMVIGEKGDDVPTLCFWAYNLTLLTYLLHTDLLVAECCDELEHLLMMRELMEDIYIAIVRTAEQRVEPLLDTCMLDHTPLGPAEGFDPPQFEGEWNFLKGMRDTLRLKRPASANASPTKLPSATTTPRDSPARREMSVSMSGADLAGLGIGEPKGLAELRKAASRPDSPLSRSTASAPSGKDGVEEQNSPKAITELFSSLLMVLRLYGINPAFIVQIFSQIFLWMSAEMFNRVLTRNKYLCRSRAVQILMNISVLEDWASREGLPRSVVSKHFEPLSQLLQWLQCSSQIDQFANLVATIQTLRRINPFQMRRAVRDYRYEVNESHMNEECAQYLAQLQRDWDKRRIQLGVEDLRKQMEAKQRAREEMDDENEFLDAVDANGDARQLHSYSPTKSSAPSAERTSIDSLFDPERTMADWSPPDAEMAIGELQNTRFVLPLVWPSDLRNLVAVPSDSSFSGLRPSSSGGKLGASRSRPSSVASMASVASVRSSRPLEWKRQSTREVRDTWTGLPRWVDDAMGRRPWDWDDYRGNKYVKANLQGDEEEEDERVEVEEILQAFSSLHASRLRKSSTIRRPESSRPAPAVGVALPTNGSLPKTEVTTTETARSSADSSIRTPSLSVDISSPPLSPTHDHSVPLSPDDLLDDLRRSGSLKAKRQWRQKRREGSDITLRPDEKTPIAETTPLKEAFTLATS